MRRARLGPRHMLAPGFRACGPLARPREGRVRPCRLSIRRGWVYLVQVFRACGLSAFRGEPLMCPGWWARAGAEPAIALGA